MIFLLFFFLTAGTVDAACRVSRLKALRASKGTGKVTISPSVAKANFLNLGADLGAVVDAGAEWLHFSVQDGRMVPKISFGSPIIAGTREAFPSTVFDVKLGVIEPEHRIAEFVKAGADIISFHPEATLQPVAVLNAIVEAGCAPGIILNPGTPLSAIEHYIDLVDVVVVMLVNPGWGGPKYMDAALAKICSLKKMCAARGVNPYIEVDGGVSSKNAPELLTAGANVLVAGSSVFESENKAMAIGALRGASKFAALSIPETASSRSNLNKYT
jgi:ribulose-phosphate 3-epimerase